MAAPVDPGDFSAHTDILSAAANLRFQRLYAALGLAAVGDDLLTSPTNTVWRTVATSQGCVLGLATTASYFSTNGVVPSGGAGALTAQGLWVPSTADVAVAGKTTRLRIRVPWVTNATGPGITVTWGLYPVNAIAGGSSVTIITLGTVIAGSTAAVSSPGAGAASQATSAGFDISAVTSGNVYIVGVVGSGSQAAASVVNSQIFLEMRHT